MNAKTRMFMCGTSLMGRAFGTRGTSSGVASAPTSRPTTPPASASSRLSVNIWRRMRPRPAPIATRTAISRLRVTEREYSRFAREAHAIRIRQKAAPNTTITSIRDCGEITSRSATTAAPMPSFSF